MATSRPLTPKDVAVLFGVTVATVGEWERAGKLRASFRTPGGHRRYLQSDLDAFIASSRPDQAAS